ncbi:hypothetical protein NM208_g10114 [Fusarium decemcellulare]|uniref:Uncharacterized protein n=1 Tax=Fusarium decemcellulare TaxID=57161 RepID=A0ACC1RZ31_9HYPO|nr:hypothetical protein NM208_g10114 [Fusarium decemcellulare]
MEDTGRMTFTLRRNHRARMRVAEWARDMFYGGTMTIVHRNHILATTVFDGWTQENFHVRSSTLMILPPGSEETQVGYSFANVTNMKWVSQLVVQMYRKTGLIDVRNAQAGENTDPKTRQRRASTFILTPYAVQKNAYDLILEQMDAAKIPKTLSNVLTTISFDQSGKRVKKNAENEHQVPMDEVDFLCPHTIPSITTTAFLSKEAGAFGIPDDTARMMNPAACP